MSEETATISEMVEALLVFDESLLNSRYHGLLSRYPEGRLREELVALPGLILKSGRAARSGAEKWALVGNHAVGGSFLEWGERMLLDSFLSQVESQMRLLSTMMFNAPTEKIRRNFSETVEIHRQAARTLREALSRLSYDHAPSSDANAIRALQEEAAMGSLRSQIEAAMRAMTKAGHGIRYVSLSSAGYRHLRDQGLFQGGTTTIEGVPVVVDFAWDAPGFVLQSFDALPLEEINPESLSGETPPPQRPAGP